jgi:hypothetical protein
LYSVVNAHLVIGESTSGVTPDAGNRVERFCSDLPRIYREWNYRQFRIVGDDEPDDAA